MMPPNQPSQQEDKNPAFGEKSTQPNLTMPAVSDGIAGGTALRAIAPRGQREAISSATASGAIASQESLPLSPDRSEPTDCIEPALIGEHSLLSVTSSPTEPSPNVSESPGDWLTLSEAHKIAQANGYEGSKDSFRMLPSYQQDYNQIYGQYGLKADLERRSQRGKPSRYFCRHSLS